MSRRFSVRLPRPLSIGLVALVLVVAGIVSRVGFQMCRRQAAARKFREMEAISESYAGGPRWVRSWLSDDWLQRFDDQFDGIGHIDLAHAEPNDDDLAALTAIPGLRSLTLPGAATDSGLRHLRELSDLVILDLQGPRISDGALRHIERLP
jgi:hypothetical protein